MPMVWSNSFSIGVEAIDKQHQELFKRTNQLLEACQQGRGKEAVSKTLTFLEDYVNTHFSYEESLMQKYAYPEFTAHQNLHREFTQSLLKLKQEAQNNIGLSLVTQVNKFVVDWWINHITKVDKKLGAFLSEKMK